MTAGTFETRFDSTTVTPNSAPGCATSSPACLRTANNRSIWPDWIIAAFTMKRPANRTSRCQSIKPSISREAMRRETSSAPAAASATISRGQPVKRKAAITRTTTTMPFTVCQRSKAGASTSAVTGVRVPAAGVGRR